MNRLDYLVYQLSGPSHIKQELVDTFKLMRKIIYHARNADSKGRRVLQELALHRIELIFRDQRTISEGVPAMWEPSRKAQALICFMCGNPAACIGSYEGHPIRPACDDCCGHGEEDGWCVLLGAPAAPEADMPSASDLLANWMRWYVDGADRNGGEVLASATDAFFKAAPEHRNLPLREALIDRLADAYWLLIVEDARKRNGQDDMPAYRCYAENEEPLPLNEQDNADELLAWLRWRMRRLLEIAGLERSEP